MNRIGRSIEYLGMRTVFQFIVVAVVVLGIMVALRGYGFSPKVPTIFIGEPLETVLEQADKDGTAVLVKFTAAWCGPCRVMDADVFSNPEHADAIARMCRVKAVNIDEFKETARAYQIEAIPTLVLIKDGIILARHDGGMNGPGLIKWLKNSLKSY